MESVKISTFAQQCCLKTEKKNAHKGIFILFFGK